MADSSDEDDKTAPKAEDMLGKIKIDEEDPVTFNKLTKNLPRHKFYTDLKYVIDPSVGLIYVDKKLISAHRMVAINLIKKVGSNLLTGKSIMNISFPVNIFGTTTFLHHTVKDFGYAPYYLGKANETSNADERMSCIISMVCASIHLNAPQQKPFNPVLGETLQAKMGDAMVYCEQIVHHPPISAFQVYGKGYYIHGSLEYEINMMPNTAKYSKKGYSYITLNDKTKYRVTLPSQQIEGVLFGKRILLSVGEFTVEDLTNKIFARVKIYPEKRGFLKSIFVKQKDRKDHIKGYITRDPKEFEKYEKGIKGKKIIDIEGHWIDDVSIAGKKCWDLEAQECAKLEETTSHLLSDSSEREDLRAYRLNNEDEANKQKEILENIQRNDRKLREPFDKIREKMMAAKVQKEIEEEDDDY